MFSSVAPVRAWGACRKPNPGAQLRFRRSRACEARAVKCRERSRLSNAAATHARFRLRHTPYGVQTAFVQIAVLVRNTRGANTMRAVSIQPELLTRPQAAAFLNLSEMTLRRWYAESTGPRVVKLGVGRASRVRYPRSELVAFAQDPTGYTAQTRPANVPHFEPPSRGNPRQRKAAK